MRIRCIGVFLLLGFLCAWAGPRVDYDDIDQQQQKRRRKEYHKLTVSLNTAMPERGLDPLTSLVRKDENLMELVFERLLYLDGDLRLQPRIAYEWSQVNPTTYRFNLRRGLQFNNGRQLDSKDVVRCMEFILDPQQNSPLRPLFAVISSVTAPKSHQVLFKLKRPDSSFLAKLATYFYLVQLDAYQKEGGTFSHNPVGCGPFSVFQWDTKKQRSIRFKYNINYWDDRAREIKEIKLLFYPESARYQEHTFNMLLNLRVDLLLDFKRYVNRYYSQVAKIKHYKKQNGAFPFIVFNTRSSYFKDPKMRAMFALAIDYEALIAIAENNCATGMGMSTAVDLGYNQQLKGYTTDTVRARRYLEESGNDDFEVTLTATENTMAIALALQKQLSDMGIRMEIDQQPLHVLYERIMQHKRDPRMPEWGGDFYLVDGLPVSGQPTALYELFVRSGSVLAFAENKEFDTLLSSTLAETGKAELQKIEELHLMVRDNTWLVPLYQYNTSYGFANDLVYIPNDRGVLSLRELFYE